MEDQLYNDEILGLASELDKNHRLEAPDISITVDSPLCGSRMKIDLKYDADCDLITDYGHEVRACALGQASAAVMEKYVVGRSAAEMTALYRQMIEMLKKDGEAPSGIWHELANLAPATAYKSRHASILLPFKGVTQALDSLPKDQKDAG